jgi:hypothetical protein
MRSVFAFVSLGLASSFASAANASTIGSNVYFAVDLHYSSQAYSKSVDSVMAHVGVLTQHPSFSGRENTWQNVKDVSLSAGQNGFTARTALRGQGSDGSYKVQLDPIVVYFVNFKDGSSLISEPSIIQGSFASPVGYDVRYQGSEFLKAATFLLQNLKDPTETKTVLKATSFEWDSSSQPLTDLLNQSGLSSIYLN